MSILKKMIILAIFCSMMGTPTNDLEAITYVTDTGGYAYDESRAATNLAPAIALGTVAIVGIIAIAVQNSHDHHSSSSHYGSYSSNSYCDYSSYSSGSCH